MLNEKGKLINKEVRIEVTNLCNAKCVICNHPNLTRDKGTMDTGFFRDIVWHAKELGATTISPFGFGEPLLDPGLKRKVLFCASNHLDTFITTNGSIKEVISLLTVGVSHIRFSIHGINKKGYEAVHKGLSWDTVMKNLVKTLEVRDLFYRDVKISVSVIPMNGETVEQIKEFWKEYDVELEIWKPHNWRNNKNYRVLHRKKNTCGRPFTGPVQIQWDGSVIPCCFCTDNDVILGDVHQYSIEKILKGFFYERFREKHRIGDLKGLPCEHCDQLNVEEESPLLYSSIDKDRNINITSSIKFKL